LRAAAEHRERRGVAVTGLGVVSALGFGADELWEGLLGGACALGPSPTSPRGVPVPRSAGAVGGATHRVEELVDPRTLRRLATLSRHALGAAALALRESGTLERWAREGDQGAALRDATAVLLGTSYGPSAYHFEYYEKLFTNGIKDASPLLFSESVMNAAPGHVAIHWKLRGPSLALVGGEEVGLAAVADALDRIRLGESSAALAGGAEEYCDFVHAALATRRVIAAERGEPFSGAEAGSFLGEGAAFLFLEDPAPGAGDAATGNLVEVAGAGFARGPAGPGGPARAVELAVGGALADAGVGPEAVDLVVASASGRRLDREEAIGLDRALLSGARRPRRPIHVVAPKAALGEGFAFTSAIQALVAVKALQEGTVPPAPAGAQAALLPPGFEMPRDPVEADLEGALAVALGARGNAVAVYFRVAR
jgi:3-oxoacyl-(acyl-carrier-protein) synthase